MPLILWLVNRGKAPYAAQQSKQAFFFHVGLVVVEMVILYPWLHHRFYEHVCFHPLAATCHIRRWQDFLVVSSSYGRALFAIQIVAIVFGIIGAVKAFKGEPFHYPLMGRV